MSGFHIVLLPDSSKRGEIDYQEDFFLIPYNRSYRFDVELSFVYLSGGNNLQAEFGQDRWVVDRLRRNVVFIRIKRGDRATIPLSIFRHRNVSSATTFIDGELFVLIY